jgi:hypothetical protein
VTEKGGDGAERVQAVADGKLASRMVTTPYYRIRVWG